MGVLTSSAEYTTFVTEMNTAIKNFVKNHGSAVKYSKTENGKSLITLFYGRERDTDLRKIADTIATTLNDASFEIDGLPVTPIKANESVIVFEGDTTAIESAVNSSNEYPILKVLTEQEVSFGDVSDIGNSIISNIIGNIARNRSSIPESYFKAANITIDENSNTYGRIGINVPKLDSYLKTLTERIEKEQAEIDELSETESEPTVQAESEPSVQAESPVTITTSTQLLEVKTKFEQILEQSNEVLRIRNKKKSLLTGELETYLASRNVRFERVTAESFVIAYSLEDYSEYFDIKTDEEYSLTNDDEPVKGKTYYLRDEASDGNVTYRQAINTDFDTNYYDGEFEEVDKETETYDSNTTYYVDIPGVDVLGPENPSAYRPAVVGENSDDPGDSDFDIDPDSNEVSFSDDETYYKKISDPYTKQSFDGQNDYYEKVKA